MSAPSSSSSSADAPFFALDRLRATADRLARAARECVRQHERWAVLCERADVDEAEVRGWSRVVLACDVVLDEAVKAYESVGARQHPTGEDEAWWHRANSLWHAGREWLRRHARADQDTVRTRSRHTSAELGALAIDSALEASALFALRQALESYLVERPGAKLDG